MMVREKDEIRELRGTVLYKINSIENQEQDLGEHHIRSMAGREGVITFEFRA